MNTNGYFGEDFYELENLESQYQSVQNNNQNGFNGSPLFETKGNINHTIEENSVNSNFFSNENINKIQQSLIASIFNKSKGKYKIGKQDEEQLKIIMRSIYLQNSKNLPYDIEGQVETLNNLVLEYSISNVYTEIQQYIGYLRDSSTLPLPNERPMNVEIKGEKTVERTRFI